MKSLASSIIFVFYVFFSSNALSEETPALVNLLTNQLAVTPEQALGGTGAIFNFAKNSLSEEQFAQLAEGVPNMSQYLDAVPKLSKKAAAISEAASLLGGTKNNIVSDMVNLKNSFKALDLKAGMIQQFTPVIVDYVKQTSGNATASILSGLFSQ